MTDVESVAEHTFSACAISMILADLENRRGARVDLERVLRMAVLHDLAEALTFDISQAHLGHMGRRGLAIKKEVEAKSWAHIIDGLNDRELARKYKSMQSEYDLNSSVESKIVHAADSLDILLQALDYRRMGYPENLLEELWNERRKMIQKSDVVSAKKLLKLIVRENETL
jgi:putative hydrolase of HD superfamily